MLEFSFQMNEMDALQIVSDVLTILFCFHQLHLASEEWIQNHKFPLHSFHHATLSVNGWCGFIHMLLENVLENHLHWILTSSLSIPMLLMYWKNWFFYTHRFYTPDGLCAAVSVNGSNPLIQAKQNLRCCLITASGSFLWCGDPSGIGVDLEPSIRTKHGMVVCNKSKNNV